MDIGIAIPASTLRPSGPPGIGQTTGAAQSQLTGLTARGLPFGGTTIVLQPADHRFVTDTFGVGVQQPAMVILDWPTTTKVFPIRRGDKLVLPSGTYDVLGIRPWPGEHIEVYVEVPITS